jgi:hypothetical protein
MRRDEALRLLTEAGPEIVSRFGVKRLRLFGSTARDEARANLSNMAKSLHRDPQLESLLQNRRADLGLKPSATGSLSHDLQQYLGRSRGMGISM